MIVAGSLLLLLAQYLFAVLCEIKAVTHRKSLLKQVWPTDLNMPSASIHKAVTAWLLKTATDCLEHCLRHAEHHTRYFGPFDRAGAHHARLCERVQGITVQVE